VKLRRGPQSRSSGVLGAFSGLVLPWMMPPLCLAQGGGDLSVHLHGMLLSAGVLAVVLAGLVVWEILDRRASVSASSQPPVPAGAGVEEPDAGTGQEDEDPFRALLKKASSDESKAQVQGSEPPSVHPESASPGGGPEPTSAPTSPERTNRVLDEELSPFQRLAQIGSEDRQPLLAPPPEVPGKAPRIELSQRGPGPAEKSTGVPAEKPAGDWASLLSKVEAEVAPAPRGPVFPPKSGEEDPWKKLLGQAAPESPPAPAPREPSPAATGGTDSAAEADPWKALLSKASPEAAAPPPPPLPAIKLGSAAPSSRIESPRPRSISLDLNTNSEEGRGIPPPPQTEDE